MRFTNGKYNEQPGDGLDGAYSWAVIFDDQADKLKYSNELAYCLVEYRKKIKVEATNLLALKKMNGAQMQAIKEITKLYQQKIAIRNLLDATLNNGLEFDFVFISERDQGVGRFKDKQPCLKIADAEISITQDLMELLWTQNKSLESGQAGRTVMPLTN